ncbi:MAG: ATP12 family protein [Alphaproteobacteria bacterium]
MDFIAAEKYVTEQKEKIISLLIDYAMTDTILFWSEDEVLNKLQKQQWQPMIDKFNEAVSTDFKMTYGLNISPENEKNKSILQKYIDSFNKKELSALYAASASMKSVFLGLLLAKKKINASEAFKSAFLEELHQNSLWGEEKEAVAKREQVKTDLLEIEEYLQNG